MATANTPKFGLGNHRIRSNPCAFSISELIDLISQQGSLRPLYPVTGQLPGFPHPTRTIGWKPPIYKILPPSCKINITPEISTWSFHSHSHRNNIQCFGFQIRVRLKRKKIEEKNLLREASGRPVYLHCMQGRQSRNLISNAPNLERRTSRSARNNALS